jgi:uncharacterized protein YjiS (DUF1127 family)
MLQCNMVKKGVIQMPILRSLLFKGLLARQQQRRALAELSAIDDRTLSDIGLRRSDIPFVAAGCARAIDATRLAPSDPSSPANSNDRHANDNRWVA